MQHAEQPQALTVADSLSQSEQAAFRIARLIDRLDSDIRGCGETTNGTHGAPLNINLGSRAANLSNVLMVLGDRLETVCSAVASEAPTNLSAGMQIGTGGNMNNARAHFG